MLAAMTAEARERLREDARRRVVAVMANLGEIELLKLVRVAEELEKPQRRGA
jgi:hypothetical protein